MSWHVYPWIYPVWDSLDFLDLGGYFLSQFRELLTIFSSTIFSYPFLLSSSWTTMIRMLLCLMLSLMSLRLSSLFLSFFFIVFCFSYFQHFIFQLTYPFFCLSYSTVGSLQYISNLYYCLLIVDCLFFNPSRSLLNIYCIFLIHASSLFICASILFSRFWICFTIIILNFFSGRLPISSSFVWSCGFLPCSFICCMFLCIFILFNLLCLGSPFFRLESHSSS